MKAPTLRKDSFTTFANVSILCFAPLGVMPRTNTIVEIAAASECYLIINLLKNKESKKQLFRIYLPIKLAEGKISMKKEKNSSKLIYNIASFSKMAGKTDFFFRKNKLNMTLTSLVVKYLENLGY